MDLSSDWGALMDLYSNWGALMDLSSDWGALMDMSSNWVVTGWFGLSPVLLLILILLLFRVLKDQVPKQASTAVAMRRYKPNLSLKHTPQ